MSEITRVSAHQVWDSRGRPTIEVEVELASGALGRSIAPSGASTGSREALDRRDGGKRLGGFGVGGAIQSTNGEVATALRGLEASDQARVDRVMRDLDGTAQKTRLGGNALIATSQAVAWAAASEKQVPLWAHLRALAGIDPSLQHVPAPMIQIFGGGKHAGGRIDIQDYLVIANGATSFDEACEWIAEVYIAAGKGMHASGHLCGVADEGGHWPDFTTNEEGLERLTRAIEAAGFRPLVDVGIALDVAATSFFVAGRYRLGLETRELDTQGMIEMLAKWCERYPILSLEDPLSEDDSAGFAEITRRLGHKVQIVGDDYLTTDATRIRAAADAASCNAVLLKANQCGTVSELIDAAKAASEVGFRSIQSGRSGESEDVTLSHLAVGLLSHQIKVGSMTRSERTAKWNEVLRIERRFSAPSYWQFTTAYR